MMVPKSFILDQAACDATTEHMVSIDPKWAGFVTADMLAHVKPLTPITVHTVHGPVNMLSGHLEPCTDATVNVIGSAPACPVRREQAVTVLRYSQVSIWGLEMDEVPTD
jgi:hypothetical protein